VELPKGPYSTVAGLLTYHLRRIPKKGEQTNIQGVMFKVVQADEKKVQKVMVEKASS